LKEQHAQGIGIVQMKGTVGISPHCYESTFASLYQWEMKCLFYVYLQ